MIKCCDKKKGNWSNYVDEGWGLILDTFTYDDAGYIKSWTLCSSIGEEYNGETIPDLLAILQNIKSSYRLKRETEFTKDILVIYTDDLNKLYWFLKNYGVENVFSLYFQMFEHIEFRECWYDDLETAGQIAAWAKFMIDTVFGPDKYFYLTPNQIPRKRMKKARNKLKDTTAEDIYPQSYSLYKSMRKAYFGGILFISNPKFAITEPIIEIDLKSAYIYCLLVLKHCMSKGKLVDKANWEYYLSSPTKASFGKYKIKYASVRKTISCYKNADGEKLQPNEDQLYYEDEFYFTNTDLKIFLENAVVFAVECEYIFEYDLNYLPKYVRDELVYEYSEKERLAKEKPNSEELRIQKVIVNGEYGDCCRDWTEDEDAFDRDRDDPVMVPQWGFWTTSYCKNLILELGNQLDGWFYSATDSIYCRETDENYEKINAYNEKIRKKTKVFCDTFGYDYEALKDLGTFVVKTHIKKFKAFGPNTYVYTRNDNTIVIKASGCSKQYRKNLSEKEKEYFYSDECEYVPVGRLVRHYSNEEKTSCIIDGKEYTSNGSYYDLVFEKEMADYMNLIENMMHPRK